MDLKTKADNFFDGLLSKKESDKFIKEIEGNSEIKEYLIQRELLEGRLTKHYSKKNSLEEDVKDDIDKYLKNYKTSNKREDEFKDILNRLSDNEKKNHFFLNPHFINIAATIALFLIIGIGLGNQFIKNKRLKTNEKLYAQYFNPADNLTLHMLGVTNEDSLNYSLYDPYSSNDLNEIFHNILRSEAFDDKDLILLSIIQMKNGDDELAISQLKQILDYNRSTLTEIARWYFALANLKITENDIAIENLSILCAGKSEFKEKACELLNLITDK